MNKTVTLMAVAMTASAAQAAQVSVDASISAEIRRDTASSTAADSGVRVFNGDISTAFWNAEPDSAGAFSVTGIMQFDVSAALAQFDAQYGAGNWSLTGAELHLYQAPAGFTTDATVDFWAATADPTMTLAGLSGVDYTNVIATIGGTKVLEDYGFILGPSGQEDTIGLLGLDESFLTDGLLTIAATSDLGNASWGGSTNNAGVPFIVLTAVPAPGSLALLGLGGLVARRRR